MAEVKQLRDFVIFLQVAGRPPAGRVEHQLENESDKRQKQV